MTAEEFERMGDAARNFDLRGLPRLLRLETCAGLMVEALEAERAALLRAEGAVFGSEPRLQWLDADVALAVAVRNVKHLLATEPSR